MTIAIVEKEIDGTDWTIEWDRACTVKTYSDLTLLYEIISIRSLTPEQAYDIAMLQLEWLLDMNEEKEKTSWGSTTISME
tara:strand:- start:113 stop:352 length:240 start_codon:yes stop_codon:yes gene_type:complete